jgi:hypothetical protein
VATSADGLNFHPPADGGQPGHGVRPVMLGRPYYRVFEHGGKTYAQVVWGDTFLAPEDPWNPPTGYDYTRDYWTEGSNPFEPDLAAAGQADLRARHYGVHLEGDILYLFYSRIGDRPERIVMSTLDLSANDGDWLQWDTSFPPREILRPQRDWEGANYPPEASQGSAGTGVHQLRDPGIFQDADERVYLLYTGAGEEAIGLARLARRPEVSGKDLLLEVGQGYNYSIRLDPDVEPAALRIYRTEGFEPAILDAESDPPVLSYTGTGGYAVRQGDVALAGSVSFHLAHESAERKEIMEITPALYAMPGAGLGLKSRLTEASPGQVAAIQVSTDDGQTWRDLWVRTGAGAGDPGQSVAEDLLLPLKDLAGQIFRLRFVYEHDPLRDAAVVTGTESGKGWYLDDIALISVERAEVHEQRELGADAAEFAFTPDQEGRFLLTVGGTFAGEPTGFGPVFSVRAFDEVPQARVLDSSIENGEFRFQVQLDPRFTREFTVKGADTPGKPMLPQAAEVEALGNGLYEVVVPVTAPQMIYQAAPRLLYSPPEPAAE